MDLQKKYGLFLTIVLLICTNLTLGKLEKFLQPGDIGNRYTFAPSNDTTSCTRECLPNRPSRVCYYKFHLEYYATLTEACLNCTVTGEACDLPQCVAADGFERSILSVNRRLPGPSIQVCKGDRIVVDIHNHMSASSTTIHWHGMFQRGTQYQDGVPLLTQCPISESSTYRYNFNAMQAGAFFWHAHEGFHKLDGIQGSLIIREPKKLDLSAGEYDYDLPAHVIFLTDWHHMVSANYNPGLTNPDLSLYGLYYLINGRGRFKDPKTGKSTKSPYNVFRVTAGKRYRFRIVGATCRHCSARLSIKGHSFKIIASDGNAINPIEVEYLDIYSGERYDIVLNANKAIRSYWIKVIGMGTPCDHDKFHQMAILKYEGSNQNEPSTLVTEADLYNTNKKGLNSINSTCTGEGNCIAKLESVEKYDKKVLKPKADISFTMNLGYYHPSTQEEFQRNTYVKYSKPDPAGNLVIFHINNISYTTPSSPLLSQRKDLPSNIFCSEDSNGFANCEEAVCHCLQILRIPLGAVAEFILIDKSDAAGMNHPFHLHGYAFNVIAMGYMEDISERKVMELMKSRTFPYSSAPVLKDTVPVPSRGYTVLRILADNPGYWLFHCHFLTHHTTGMNVVMQVGEPEDLPPVPKGFPKCGNYVPSIP